jgi:hypothetical protein
MTFVEYLNNCVDIIAKYAVKDHYTDNGADYEQLEEIKRASNNLRKYSHDYEDVYRHAEEVQVYIVKKMKERK